MFALLLCFTEKSNWNEGREGADSLYPHRRWIFNVTLSELKRRSVVDDVAYVLFICEHIPNTISGPEASTFARSLHRI